MLSFGFASSPHADTVAACLKTDRVLGAAPLVPHVRGRAADEVAEEAARLQLCEVQLETRGCEPVRARTCVLNVLGSAGFAVRVQRDAHAPCTHPCNVVP